MSASFAPALSAAREAASHQHYPQGALFVVATPIGNLADVTLRALHVLALVDAVACEDTRHTQQLLRAYGIERPGAQLLAVHQHNEAEAGGSVIDHLRHGLRIAFERQNMRRDAVEKPTVVRDHHRTAGETFETFFERAYRVDVDVVRRFIEQQ